MAQAFISLIETNHPLYGWRTVLDQIKTPYSGSNEPQDAFIYIASKISNTLLKRVENGAVLIIEQPNDLSMLGVYKQGNACISRIYLPEYGVSEAVIPMMIDIYPNKHAIGYALLNENRIVKEEIHNGKLPFILPIYHGKGLILATSGKISNLLFTHGNDLRTFSDHTPVTERVSSIDKNKISEIMIQMLKEAHRFLKLPMFTLSYYPKQMETVYMVRIDVDGVFQNNAVRLAEICEKYQTMATFYVNKSLCEGEEEWLKKIENKQILATHGNIHNVFDNYVENCQNIIECEEWLKKTFPHSKKLFVAPRGMYHENLGQALLNSGYTSSSDFGYLFDGFPHFVLINDTISNLLQIPCNPFCVGRSEIYGQEMQLEINDDTIIKYYQNIIEDKIRKKEPIMIYGHPHGLGKRTEILDSVLHILKMKNISSMSIEEFEIWWRKRHAAKIEVTYNEIDKCYEVSVSDRAFAVEVSENVVYKLNDTIFN